MLNTPLFRLCSYEKPTKHRSFWYRGAFHDGFEGCQKTFKNTLEKVPFLLVRFLWANKENEQAKGRIIFIKK